MTCCYRQIIYLLFSLTGITSSISRALASHVRETQRIHLKRIPEDLWIAQETFSSVPSLTSCSVIADRRTKEHYYYSYDKDSKECQLGKAYFDMVVEETVSVGRMVAGTPYANFTQLGLINQKREFDVLLPNGQLCPRKDHQIPPLPTSYDPYIHGTVEIGGFIFVAGGARQDNEEDIDDCWKLDMREPNPSWRSMEKMPAKGKIMRGGLISYNWNLFAFYQNMCQDNSPNGGHVVSYSLAENEWATLGKLPPRHMSGPPVVNGNLVYFVGGASCEIEDETLNEILTFDLNRPFDEPDRKVGLLQLAGSLGLMDSACGLYISKRRSGILCAGGVKGSGFVNYRKQVNFVNLKDGLPDGISELISKLPNDRGHSVMVNFGNGQPILHGGKLEDGVVGAYNPDTLKWDEEKEEFISTDAKAMSSRNWAAYGYISSKVIMDKCWKYL